jgi:hypothetical protein
MLLLLLLPPPLLLPPLLLAESHLCCRVLIFIPHGSSFVIFFSHFHSVSRKPSPSAQLLR